PHPQLLPAAAGRSRFRDDQRDHDVASHDGGAVSGRTPNRHSYLGQVMEKIEAVPGVRNAATTTALPLRGWGWGMPFLIEGQQAVDRANRPDCFYKMVSPSYLSTLGMRIVKG